VAACTRECGEDAARSAGGTDGCGWRVGLALGRIGFMGKTFDEIDEGLRRFIERQHVFFVATRRVSKGM
jgi:hypothetical protein